MMSFEAKLTARAFEDKVIEVFGVDNLAFRKTKEMLRDGSGDSVNLQLFYIKDDQGPVKTVHVATWTGGKGWIFKSGSEKYGLVK